jgi:hypothetical protein
MVSVDSCDILKKTGEIRALKKNSGAEGATAPETLRQKDRRVRTSGK